jgi:Domain of unknown function (DUF3825)
VTLHESKHSGYNGLSAQRDGRLPQPFGEPPLTPGGGTPIPPPPSPDRAAAGQPVSRRPDRALYKHADVGPLRSDLDRPPGGGEEDWFDHLARIAEPENWAGPAVAHRDSTWVLREYVEWTFERLFQQRQVLASADSQHSVFNTGLATAQQETIYGRFVPNRNSDGQPWQLAGWHVESDRQLLDHFPELPALATYTDSPSDLVYDRRRELTVNPKHLLEIPDNLLAMPGALRSNPYQAGLVLEGAVRRAEARVRRSYRAAVPCWDPAAERVKLLLPLSLTTPETVDVALVVSAEGEGYRGVGVLGLDVAYARARQIARPEEWLNAE